MANRTTVRPTCAPPAHASVGSNETSEARGDGWAWTFQPPSRANTCILASAHGTPSSTRTSKRGEASRRSSAGRLMKACRSAAATVPSHASALSRPPTTGMRSYSARAAPGRMHGGRDHEASHRAHHQPHELAVAAASDRISPKMPLLDLLSSSDTLNSLSPAKYVELAPGVFAMRPVDGLVNLGIPLGTEAYVQRKVCESIRSHDERLRCLVALAQHTGSATRAGGRCSD